MYEEYVAPLPDVYAYAKRIGLADRFETSAQFPLGTPSKELLDELVYANQTHIPFDDLNSYDLDIPVSVKTKDLFDKIVLSRRGGFCFELNNLFGHFLRAVGFEVRLVFARTMYQHDDPWPILHCGNIVTVDGRRMYCDVGCGGPMAACSIPLEEGLRTHSCGQVFSMKQTEGNWWHVIFHHDGTHEGERCVSFLDAPITPVDTIALAQYCATAPDCIFKKARLCNMRFDGGIYSLTNMDLTINRGDSKEVRHLDSNEELVEVLSTYFNIGSPELDAVLLGK